MYLVVLRATPRSALGPHEIALKILSSISALVLGAPGGQCNLLPKHVVRYLWLISVILVARASESFYLTLYCAAKAGIMCDSRSCYVRELVNTSGIELDAAGFDKPANPCPALPGQPESQASGERFAGVFGRNAEGLVL